MLFISEEKENSDELNINDLISFYSDKENINVSQDIINIISNNVKIDDNCMMILPYDIYLYDQENIDYINIRELLLKICDVKDIIYLPIGIFNSNLKLCILHFIKKRNEKFIITNNKITDIHQTSNINFYDYNYFNNTKQLLINVSINKIINNKYSFNYIDYIKEKSIFTSDQLIYKTINEIALIQYGNINRNRNNNNDNGNDNGNNDNRKYDIYGNKDKKMKSNNYNRDGFNIIITKYEIKLINEKIFLNNYGLSLKPKSDLILHKYLCYYLFYNYKNINLKTLHLFKISIPSIEIQEEIIKYLDNIHNTILKLENEIKELNNQSLYFMKKI
jgi:hypothetical protein